jgi:glc operon protein GlcG
MTDRAGSGVTEADDYCPVPVAQPDVWPRRSSRPSTLAASLESVSTTAVVIPERKAMPNITRQQSLITAEAALDAINAALEEGDRLGVRVSATVVDASLTLVAFVKADGATPHSVDTSRAKANTAASTRRATGWMGPDLAMPIPLATNGRLTNIRGGAPISVDSVVVGAIGIAGGTPEQDEAVAAAVARRTAADR